MSDEVARMGIEADTDRTVTGREAASGAEALGVLRAIWAADGQGSSDLDDDCGPTKVCRNMREVTFDGFGEPGEDVAASWRSTLEREGKLRGGAGSLRDLVLGPDAG